MKNDIDIRKDKKNLADEKQTKKTIKERWKVATAATKNSKDHCIMNSTHQEPVPCRIYKDFGERGFGS